MSAPERRQLLCDPATLRTRLPDSRLRIVDCRFDLMQPQAGRKAYLDGHIPGAVYADLDTDLSGPVGPATGRHPLPDVDALAATVRRLGIGKDSAVVVYDANNSAIAARAWWLLRWLGHDDVMLLDGGFAAWRAMNLPLETAVADVKAGDFVPVPRPQLVLTTGEIVARLPTIGDLGLVDARDSARFRGETEPIDPVAGHIPGSLNLPFTECLHDDGTWRSRRALRTALRRVLGERQDRPWAVMCGSGVTACHLAVTGLLAGFEEPRLYVGSWSEWIRNPDRPVRPD